MNRQIVLCEDAMRALRSYIRTLQADADVETKRLIEAKRNEPSIWCPACGGSGNEHDPFDEIYDRMRLSCQKPVRIPCYFCRGNGLVSQRDRLEFRLREYGL